MAEAARAKVTDGEVAAAEALTSVRHGEGPRVGFLGDPGCGKTEAMRRMIAAYLRASSGVVLVADDKSAWRQQFEGQTFKDPADLESRIQADPSCLDQRQRVIVFRGDPSRGARGGLDLESVARFQAKLAAKRRPSVCIYDEIDRATVNGMWQQNPSDIAWSFGKGREDGMGAFWGLQQTQSAPSEPFNNSTHMFVFRCVGNPVMLLKRRGYCEGGVDAVIPRLPGDELPKAQRGYFVLLRRGRPWDGLVYRFGAPRVTQKPPAQSAPPTAGALPAM